jgi:tetratricopeptide (TPR) repeat protein
MTTNSPCWYLPGEGKKPVGPFTAEQIVESWRAGRLNEKTLCWQEGMAKWLPLEQVEPLAAAIRPAAAAAAAAAPRKGGVFRRLAIRGVILAGIAIAGAVLYVYWQETNAIHQAKSLIAAGDCEEALALLRTFRNDTYFYRYSQEPEYLFALAATRQYALAADPKDLPEEPLEKPKKQFKDLFGADERWRDQAKADLADVIAGIPKKASDDLARAVVLVGFLQNLKVVEAKQLAKELLVRLKARVDAGHDPEDGDAAIVGWILRLDSSLAGDVVVTVLPDSEEMPQQVRSRLASVQHWAHEWPSLAKVLATGLVQRATDLSRTGKQQTACALLDTAEAICPELCEQCARKRLEWVKKDLADNDYAGVLRGLSSMHANNCSPAISAEAASLFLEVAKQASKGNSAVAQQAIEKAFQLQPAFGDVEPNVLLWIDLRAGPSSEKLQQCQHFLSTFATSEHRNRIQTEIIRDAVTFARSGGAGNAKEYLEAAYTEAKLLLEKQPPMKELEPHAWSLAQCLGDAEQYEKAVQIADLFCKAFPSTPLKQEIEGMVATWRTIPKSGPHAEPPGNRGRQDTLEAKLLRRKRTINTSTAVYDAVANKEIWIIEVADTCTADQFDAEQARLLRGWVSDGGVLWVNSNVLSLFGVRHDSFKCGLTQLECEPAGGSHPVLEHCKRVWLHNCDDSKAHTLQYKGVIPLLAFREAYGMGFGAPGRGSTLWSLVPYGKGWISDPKPLDLNRDEGALFWGRFGQFCLHELPWPPPVSPPTGSGGDEPGEEPPDQGNLTGTWQTSDGGRVRIVDDGTTIRMELIENPTLRTFTGELTRREAKSGLQLLAGKVEVVFGEHPDRAFHIDVTAKSDDPDHLRIRMLDYPYWARGRVDRKPHSDVWTRSDASSPAANGARTRNLHNPFAPPKPVAPPRRK